jgi:hypothetical protein
MALAVLAFAPAAMAGGAASQSLLPGISLTWNDCPGGVTASSDLAYACDANTDNFNLICSAVVSAPLAQSIGAELVLDIQSSQPGMPDWWRFDGLGTGGCRAGTINGDFDYSSSPTCTDVWAFNAFGGIQREQVGPPDHAAGNQERIVGVGAVTSTDAVTIAPGTMYGLMRIVISSSNTVGVTPCAGCDQRMCIVFNSALIRRISGAGGDVLLSTAASGNSNWATWQGSGADCTLVPTRRRTWGAIKSLYR